MYERLLGAMVLGTALVAAACSGLKTADDADADAKSATTPDAQTTSRDDGSSSPDAAVSRDGDASSDGDASNPEAGGPASGDPRFPLWRTPADAPADDAYVVSNGADGATVKDRVTGLEWQNTPAQGTFDFTGAWGHCEALVYNGASDWRMPTRIEAISIMSIKPGLGESAPTGPVFAPVTAFCTWTASRVGTSTTSAFSITDAAVGAYVMTSKCAARCVRGGASLGVPTPRNYVVDASTVTDSVTGLTWERNPPGAIGTLENASTRCQGLSGGNPSRPMRLPTFKELAGIVDETRAVPASNPMFGNFATRVFTSNPRWTVDFETGRGTSGPISFEYHSRCVVGP